MTTEQNSNSSVSEVMKAISNMLLHPIPVACALTAARLVPSQSRAPIPAAKVEIKVSATQNLRDEYKKGNTKNAIGSALVMLKWNRNLTPEDHYILGSLLLDKLDIAAENFQKEDHFSYQNTIDLYVSQAFELALDQLVIALKARETDKKSSIKAAAMLGDIFEKVFKRRFKFDLEAETLPQAISGTTILEYMRVVMNDEELNKKKLEKSPATIYFQESQKLSKQQTSKKEEKPAEPVAPKDRIEHVLRVHR